MKGSPRRLETSGQGGWWTHLNFRTQARPSHKSQVHGCGHELHPALSHGYPQRATGKLRFCLGGQHLWSSSRPVLSSRSLLVALAVDAHESVCRSCPRPSLVPPSHHPRSIIHHPSPASSLRFPSPPTTTTAPLLVASLLLLIQDFVGKVYLHHSGSTFITQTTNHSALFGYRLSLTLTQRNNDTLPATSSSTPTF